MSLHTFLLILLGIAVFGIVIADIRSEDRALFFRMQNGEDA